MKDLKKIRKNNMSLLYKKMSNIIKIKNGIRYEYEEVPHQTYTQFRSAKSQGSFFNTNISKVFKYKKLS